MTRVGRSTGSACWSPTTRSSARASSGIVRDARAGDRGRRTSRRSSAAGADADKRFDAAGRCVIPGFVDSHTHLIFAGDRADEFAARMAGAPYEAGGIRVTTEATRAASDDELLGLARARRAEALRAGITHLEIKSGYGLTVESEQRLCQLAAELTDDVTFLGAHLVPPEYEGRADDYVALVCGEMLAACAPHCRWIDVFCERGAFDAEQSRAVLEAGRAPASACASTATSSARATASRSRSRWAPPRSTTAPTSPTPTSRRWRRARPSPPSCRRPTSRPASRIRTPAGRSTPGSTVAIATNTNPGSSYTTSMPFCIALAVRDMRMTIDEALAGGDARRRAGAAPRRHRPPRARRARRRRRPRRALARAPGLPARACR